uniref:Uncharacterized protein n=1 Tax=Anguilla anguilla TaxID=7936 RepID=A0A0E9W571_ANGAN
MLFLCVLFMGRTLMCCKQGSPAPAVVYPVLNGHSLSGCKCGLS